MKKFFILLMVLYVLLLQLAAQSLEIHQIGVGWSSGHATLILAKDNTGKVVGNCLIDAGNKTGVAYSTSYGGQAVISYLNAKNIGTIDHAIVTHYHVDHMGGFVNLFDATSGVTINTIFDRGGAPSTSKISQTFKEYITAIGTARMTLSADEKIPLYKDATDKLNDITLYTIAVNGVVDTTGKGDLKTFTIPRGGPEENNRAIVLLLTFRYFRFLIAGDLQGNCKESPTNPGTYNFTNTDLGETVRNAISVAIPSGVTASGQYFTGSTTAPTAIPHICGALISHHGASNTFTGFLNYGTTCTNAGWINPKFGLVSSGKLHKHPKAETLNLLYSTNTRAFMNYENHYDREVDPATPGVTVSTASSPAVFGCGNIVVKVDNAGTVTVTPDAGALAGIPVDVTCTSHLN